MANRKSMKSSVIGPSPVKKKNAGKSKKHSSATATSEENSSRQPAKCNKCAGRPLRSQCPHTKSGRQYVAEQNAMQSLREPSVDLPPEEPTSASQAGSPRIQSAATLSAHGATLSVPMLPITPGNLFASFESISAPALVQPSVSQSSSSDPEPSPSVTSMSTMTSNSLAQLTLRENRTTGRASTSARPMRTSAQNPYHGYVQGAHRGSEVYQIVRGHSLPSPIAENTRSVKQFTAAINSIMEKCEDISRQTGCWLFIGAQHPTARSGAISYVSNRLRRDAAAQAGSIGTQFSTLTRNLIQARVQDNLELRQQLEQSRREAEEMEQVAAAERNSQRLLSKQLARYQQIHGLLPDEE